LLTGCRRPRLIRDSGARFLRVPCTTSGACSELRRRSSDAEECRRAPFHTPNMYGFPTDSVAYYTNRTRSQQAPGMAALQRKPRGHPLAREEIPEKHHHRLSETFRLARM
jgi:hypothetical protein